MGFSLGGDKSSSKGQMNQNIWDPQAQGLEQMYGAANQTYQDTRQGGQQGYRLAPGAEQMMNRTANLGFNGMQNQLGGGAWGDTSGVRDQMLSQMQGGPTNTSLMYQNIVGGPGNTYIDPMVAAMKTGMEQNRGMMQSGNAMDANSMGQGGSSRHAMENAMTNKQINQDMTQAEMNMRGDNYARDMEWKMGIAGLADQNQQSNLDRMYNMVNAGNQSQQFGMNYAPTQQANNMGQFAPWMMANQMPWMNMDAYANVMGDPTVLTDQTTRGKSGGFNLGFG